MSALGKLTWKKTYCPRPVGLGRQLLLFRLRLPPCLGSSRRYRTMLAEVHRGVVERSAGRRRRAVSGGPGDLHSREHVGVRNGGSESMRLRTSERHAERNVPSAYPYSWSRVLSLQWAKHSAYWAGSPTGRREPSRVRCHLDKSTRFEGGRKTMGSNQYQQSALPEFGAASCQARTTLG